MIGRSGSFRYCKAEATLNYKIIDYSRTRRTTPNFLNHPIPMYSFKRELLGVGSETAAKVHQVVDPSD